MSGARIVNAEIKALHKVWRDAFKEACRRNGLRYVSEQGYVVDDVYVSALWPNSWRVDDDRVKIRWWLRIKPLVLDDILWAAFMPDVAMGSRMRITRRINGSCQVDPLRIAQVELEFGRGIDDPVAQWEVVIAEFDRLQTDFIERYSGAPDFLTALREPERQPHRNRLCEVVTLIAADRPEQAVAIADAERAAGRSGGMSSSGDVYEYVAAYAKGAAAYEQFRASLIPTHDMTFVTERSPGGRIGLRRGRHRGLFGKALGELDGDERWGLILEVRPLSHGQHDDVAAVRYVQAAGTASAMTVELRGPGGSEWGAVSVRWIVGRPHDGVAAPDVPIVLPRVTETVSRHEVFDADEAAELFETFYAAGELPTGYTLRPVEGYGADGRLVDLTIS